MIKFSEKTQIFFDDVLNYQNIPDDAISISDEEHIFALDKINSGHHVFIDLTFSERRPSEFHYWNNAEWVDDRTEEEKQFLKRRSLPKLTKRKFQLYMLDHGFLDDVENAIDAIEDSTQRRRMQIEYSSSDDFERLSPAVAYMSDLLGWTDEQIDTMWEQALML
ncbi:hypothetical protein [Acinetobacter sp. TSRC1-2]|uniref:hypothetical protein n=1 Tax=unclassified Acinetobacter TaxID=196816 RepID=UPI003CF77082